VLERDPVCRMCNAAPSTVADHLVPIRDGGARFDLSNGRGVCAPCHNGPKQSADKRRG
jgi:5-methylcytosine-specific restriction protein A